VTEHGERTLRSLGGRRGAERALWEAGAGASVPELVALLVERAGGQAAGPERAAAAPRGSD